MKKKIYGRVKQSLRKTGTGLKYKIFEIKLYYAGRILILTHKLIINLILKDWKYFA